MSLDRLLGLEQVPVLQMHDDGMPLGKVYSFPKIQAACEYKDSAKRNSGLESLPPDRPQGILLCYQLLLQKIAYLLSVLGYICQHAMDTLQHFRWH